MAQKNTIVIQKNTTATAIVSTARTTKTVIIRIETKIIHDTITTTATATNAIKPILHLAR